MNNMTLEQRREAAKKRPNYLGELKLHPLYNSWRSMRNTKKGKKIGSPDYWSKFKDFYRDVLPYYEKGKRFCRKDFKKPFALDNFQFLTEEDITNSRSNTNRLVYNGKEMTIREWCIELDLNYNGVRQRYFRNKRNYTIEEILFGKNTGKSKAVKSHTELTYAKQRTKASKMISSYRCRDRKKGMDCDLDVDWFIDNVFSKSCSYCGDTKRLGADRLDNSIGHTKDNIVVACYTCNVAKSDNFSYEEMLELGKAIKHIKSLRTTSSQQ